MDQIEISPRVYRRCVQSGPEQYGVVLYRTVVQSWNMSSNFYRYETSLEQDLCATKKWSL